jgi:hypothetical protein
MSFLEKMQKIKQRSDSGQKEILALYSRESTKKNFFLSIEVYGMIIFSVSNKVVIIVKRKICTPHSRPSIISFFL